LGCGKAARGTPSMAAATTSNTPDCTAVRDCLDCFD
jgi:hypothetical protein